MTWRRGLSLALAFLPGAILAAEPEVDPAQLPRVPPTEPTNALATFRLKPGFRIELVAAEPLVVSPVAMSFDEDGRLYVVEMRDYSERRPERLGRIRLLEDTDGDGRFDKTTIFAEDLPWPTAVICWAGGVFVGATPDIIYFKDTRGDGVADLRETVYTGFGSDYAPFETNQLNVQALMNSFNWSLDNRIHGATSLSGGKVKLVDTPFTGAWLRRAGIEPHLVFREPKWLDLRGRDFSFDPRTLELRAESGGGQHGMSFDNRGRKFVCSNSDHLQLIMYEDRYAARNPYYNMPGPRVSIAVDGPAAEVFRISPDEPWRVLRTQWRVSGLVPGPIEGGGRPSGYFTGATGVTIYRGDAFPEDMVGDAFVADCGSNLVHRKKLRPDGLLLRAERAADEQKVEFLASTDNWFRPVQFANAPDGCLYLADMYREVIEHPWSLPANLKRHLDLTGGNDRGRIYRIVPERFQQRPPPRLSRFSAKTLPGLLAHPNGWHRDTAARLLYERHDAAAIPGLEIQATSRPRSQEDARPSTLAAIHSLHALAGLGALKEEQVLAGLTNQCDYALREHALKLSEPFLATPSEALLAVLDHLSTELPSSNEENSDDLQRAFTLGQIPGRQKKDALSSFLLEKFRDLRKSATGAPATAGLTTNDLPWLLAAVVCSLDDDAVELLRGFAPSFASADGQPLPGPDRSPSRLALNLFALESGFLATVSRFVGARNKPKEVADLIELKGLDFRGKAETLYALEAGLRQSGSSLQQHGAPAKLKELFELAGKYAVSPNADVVVRTAAIRLLGLEPYPEVQSNLLAIVASSAEWRDYRGAALTSLAHSGHEDFGPDLLKHWAQLTPVLRANALELLLKRPERIRALLAAVDRGTVGPAELSVAQQAQLRSHRDAAVREQAAKVFGRPPEASRALVVESFGPALKLAGIAASGRKIFQSRCASCHRLGNEGYALGPDLATVKNGGKEKVLANILDPNREVAPNYVSYTVETKEGDSLTGIIGSESGAGVTVHQANGLQTLVLRSNIASMQSHGKSLMPEGLEAGLGQQDMADLLEFILGP